MLLLDFEITGEDFPGLGDSFDFCCGSIIDDDTDVDADVDSSSSTALSKFPLRFRRAT